MRYYHVRTGRLDAAMSATNWELLSIPSSDFYSYLDESPPKMIASNTGEIMLEQTKLNVGDGVATSYYTDYTPATVIAVSETGKTVTIQSDNWKIISGSREDGSAKYSYTRNAHGIENTFTKRKNGKYILKGMSMKDGMRMVAGRRRYYDPAF